MERQRQTEEALCYVCCLLLEFYLPGLVMRALQDVNMDWLALCSRFVMIMSLQL